MNHYDFREGLRYSDDVINAVRYGYQYRKESEQPEPSFSRNCLLETSEILLWLGQNVINGIAFDLFKEITTKLYQLFIKEDSPLAKYIDPLFVEERELKKFYDYVKEFNQHSMAVTEKQFEYIKDEVRADYYGKEVAKIINQENRLPTHEEYLRIFREAESHADSVLSPKLKV